MTPRPKHRRLRFSLRVLFMVLTIFAAWLGVRANRVHRRDELMLRGVTVAQWPTPPSHYFPATHVVERILLGDMDYEYVYVSVAATELEFQHAKAAFPEAHVSRLYPHGHR